MHERIRRFNTRDTYPEQQLDNDLCQAVVARGSMVFIRGQVGQDLDTAQSVAIGDPAAQAERAMSNIATLLREAGGALEHICKITIYLTDPRFRESVYRVVGTWLRGVFPVSTGLVVSALARPEWLVEIDVIAVLPIPVGLRRVEDVTFSIVARAGEQFGLAIASSSPAVGARCAHARAGIGAVATQNVTDPALGPTHSRPARRRPERASGSRSGLRDNPFAAYRQLLVIGASGVPAIYSGGHSLGTHAAGARKSTLRRLAICSQSGRTTAMLRAFHARSGPLGERLLTALQAGVEQGGEAGPVRSAGLLIVREVAWPIVDLRVDWDRHDPVQSLQQLWRIYAPQVDDYVNRALDPRRAPGFGVPGDP